MIFYCQLYNLTPNFLLDCLFLQYNWLWQSDKDAVYEEIAISNPVLDDYETQLRRFGTIQKDIEKFSSIHIIGTLSLNTKHLKLHLGQECDKWKFKVCQKLIVVLTNNFSKF